MPPFTWLAALVGMKPARRPPSPYLLDAEGFEQAARCEQMRVDRNGSVVSLLLIELPSEAATPRDVSRLARLLEGRLRLTDTTGLLSDGRVGVLLPDTPQSGAWKVAEDICETYPLGGSRPDCEVLVYPEKPAAPRPQKEDGGARPTPVAEPGVTASSAVSRYDHMLIRPTPFWKRALDIVGASFGVLLTGPVILAAAAAVRMTSPGGAFYMQEREGLGGERFKILKLRTMRVDADSLKPALRSESVQDGPAFKLHDDPRVTPIGRLLRRTSLDELPQLINVLRGEMSLVGPRPLPVDESLACSDWQRRRLHVAPGMTCTWQVFGRNIVPFDDWIRMDLRYAEGRSLTNDLKLVAQTAPAVLFSKGPR